MLFTLRGSVYYLSHALFNLLITRYGIIILISSLFLACRSYVPVKKLDFFLRDGCNQLPLINAHVAIKKNTAVIKELTTDVLGHATVKLKDIKIEPNSLDQYTLEWYSQIPDGRNVIFLSDRMRLNKYIHTYDLYLVDTIAHPNGTCSKFLEPTADMHYHVSMRTHNYFGEWIYSLPKDTPIPTNLNWYKSYKSLKILTADEHGLDYKKLSHHSPEGINDYTLRFLQSQMNSYDKPGSNKLTQFTQATNPHLLEGNVQLAYNAISPFEQANTRTYRNRLAGNLFVTGARWEWMNKIAQRNKGEKMTHWKNFNQEYKMITRQDQDCNNFHWRFLDTPQGLEEGCPTVVMVVEGSHILQDTLFPNFVNYNMGKRTEDTNIDLLENILRHKFPDRQRNDTITYKHGMKFIKPDTLIINYTTHNSVTNTSNVDSITLITKNDSITVQKINKLIQDNASYTRTLKYLDPPRLHTLIQDSLSMELVRNIDSVKRLDPPICMMNISHLAYNGMTGHASAWDQGGFINNLVARRNYGLRVSDDPSYRKQWEAAFFSVPGVNDFGKLVFNKLLDTTNGHRILIDLKHSAPSTRQFFLDSVMMPRVLRLPGDTIPADTIFPICSHCAVTGFPRMYSSPFVNEFNITRAPFVHTLYPFALNIYDEEITQICQYNGIIGIPLEQKILGSYINKMETRSPRLTKSGEMKENKHQQIKRWNYVKRYLRYLNENDPEIMKKANCYSRTMLGETVLDSTHSNKFTSKEIQKVTYRDYKSAEPFLYNVFHVIDKSYKQKLDAWKHICIGSDMDGLVDPIDICPTASQYPKFKERLRQFIPIFLKLRKDMNLDPTVDYKKYGDYFPDSTFTVDNALNQLFYQSLFDFTQKRMLQKKEI